MLHVPLWTFAECLDPLQWSYGHTDLVDDLTPEAERQLCTLAEQETGIAAVFVLGFPLSARPFYTNPRSDGHTAAGFDLLFRGVEITTGGQRLHRRAELEQALRQRGVDPQAFVSHLCMFDLGMPPHGGLALGAERLTAQVLGLRNVREATLYPRDIQRMTP
jgi:nondiscriminating aspartyl-tRNA synthetase